MAGTGDEPESLNNAADQDEPAFQDSGGQDSGGQDPAGQDPVAGGDAARLDLDEDERLPWLESIDDEDEYGSDNGRLLPFLLGGLVVLAALVGGIWWATHRDAGNQLQADGSVIEAPKTPYKEAPKDPGGKTFAGTGDTSYAVSAGQTRTPKLDHGGEVLVGGGEAPKAGEKPGDKPALAPSGVGVQVGAYTSLATAETGWTRLSSQHDAVLSGVKHRVVEGKADIGTVYRLQAMAGDAAGANELCSRLKAAGVACQVKN